MRDAGGQTLSKRCELFRLHKPILRSSQILKRLAQFGRTLRDLLLEVGMRLFQLAGHVVELIGERFQFVAGVDRNAVGEIAAAEPRRALAQLPDRTQHRLVMMPPATSVTATSTTPMPATVNNGLQQRGAQRRERPHNTL